MTITLRMAAICLICASMAPGAAVYMSTDGNTAAIGNPVTISFIASGLSNGSAPALAAFDIDVLFDPMVLQYESASFVDPVTGVNQLDFPESSGLGFLGIGTDLGGVIDVFGVSGNSASLLNLSQNDEFVFVRLLFTTLKVQQTGVALDLMDASLLFGDADGNPLAVDYGRVSAVISPAGPAIPEPGTWALVAGAAPLLLALRRLRGAR